MIFFNTGGCLIEVTTWEGLTVSRKVIFSTYDGKMFCKVSLWFALKKKKEKKKSFVLETKFDMINNQWQIYY